jgi:polar amino acid transport system substrate-binding protein
MKKFLRGWILAISLLGLIITGGCSKDAAKTSVQDKSVLDKVQSTGVLRVGYFLFEPAVMHDKDGKPYGFFVDMVEQIAKELKWKVEYKQVDLKNFAASLQAGDFDLSLGATFASPNRASGVAFANSIFYLGYTGVTTPDKVGKFKTWADLDQPGIKVAVKQGSAIGDYVRRNFTKATIVALEESSLSAPLAAVPGQADVGLMNQITVYTYLRDNPKSSLKEILADQPVEFTGVSWAVRQGDPKWLEFVNTSVKYLEDTGRTQEWEKKYKIPYLYHEKRNFKFDSGERKGSIER